MSKKMGVSLALAVVFVMFGFCALMVRVFSDAAPPAPAESPGQGLGASSLAKKVPASEAPKPETISEGTYLVGEDVKAGKYKTAGAADSVIPMCYWDVRTGSEEGEIVAQGVKNGKTESGLVTLKKGQYFTTSGCREWTAR